VKLDQLKRAGGLKNYKKPVIAENYYAIQTLIHAKEALDKWIVKELITQDNDILLSNQKRFLDRFTDFKSPVYSGVSQATFNSLQPRIHSLDQKLAKPYKESRLYKVICLNYLNTRFNHDFFTRLVEDYPGCELVLGFN
jgi:hypothetical protein